MIRPSVNSSTKAEHPLLLAPRLLGRRPSSLRLLLKVGIGIRLSLTLGKALADKAISLTHLPSVDPNFLALAASTPAELKAVSATPTGQMIRTRRDNLEKYLQEAKTLVANSAASLSFGKSSDGKLSFEQRMVAFLEEKSSANNILCEVMDGSAGSEREAAFMEASRKAWAEDVPNVLRQLEDTLLGPYTLGDQVVNLPPVLPEAPLIYKSLADLHIIAWLARLVKIAGGDVSEAGVVKLGNKIGKDVGPKIRAFWAEWIERDSLKRV